VATLDLARKLAGRLYYTSIKDIVATESGPVGTVAACSLHNWRDVLIYR